MAYWFNTSNHNLFYFHFDDLTVSDNRYFLTLKQDTEKVQPKTIIYISQTEHTETPLAQPPQLSNTRFTVLTTHDNNSVSHIVQLLSDDLTMKRNVQIIYRNSNNLFDLTQFVKANQLNINGNETWCIMLDNKKEVSNNQLVEKTMKLYQFTNQSLNQFKQLVMSYNQLGIQNSIEFTIQDQNGATVDLNAYSVNWGQDTLTVQFKDQNLQIDGTWRIKYYVNSYSETSEQYINGTWIKTNRSDNDRINYIIDILLNPSILQYRQIGIYHEPAIKLSGNKFKFTYQNWNQAQIQLFLNNDPHPLNKNMYNVNYEYGIITVNFDATDGDNLMCSYNFDYFPLHILQGFIHRAVSQINVGTVGTVTDYSLANAPTTWDGLIADFAYVYCLDKLILDYDIWKGRLIFALPPQALADGSGDIISQLQSLKSTAMDRISVALNNPKFKAQQYIALPTQAYYAAIINPAVGGFSLSKNTILGGKLRGLRINRFGTGGF